MIDIEQYIAQPYWREHTFSDKIVALRRTMSTFI